MTAKNVLILGATGMVGGLALRAALKDPRVGRVTVIVRRATGLQHAKLREVLHGDFLDYGPVAESLDDQHAALFCLGAYTGSVPDAELRRITVDCAAAFAKALVARSPGAAVCLLSGQGADRTERSRVSFARYKGMAENALLAAGFPRVHVFRPGYIYPVTPRAEPNFGYRVMRALYPVVSRPWPNVGVPSDGLAAAMLDAALEGTGDHEDPVLENRDIRRLITHRA